MNRAEMCAAVVTCVFGVLLLASSSAGSDVVDVTSSPVNGTVPPPSVTEGPKPPQPNITTEQATTATKEVPVTAKPAQQGNDASGRSPIVMTAVGVSLLSIIFVINQ